MDNGDLILLEAVNNKEDSHSLKQRLDCNNLHQEKPPGAVDLLEKYQVWLVADLHSMKLKN